MAYSLVYPGQVPSLGAYNGAGLTAVAMHQLCSHRAMSSFPIYLADSFLFPFTRQDVVMTLMFGRERQDGYCMIYMSANLTQAVPHWTFGIFKPDVAVCVEMAPAVDIDSVVFIGPLNREETEEPVYPDPIGPEWPPPAPYPVPVVYRPEAFVVYTEIPIPFVGPHIYWRAKLTPENQSYYSDARNMGCACLCDWGVLCEHTRPLNDRISLFLDTPVVTPGSWLGTIIEAVSPYQLLRMGNRSKLRMDSGGLFFNISGPTSVYRFQSGLFHTPLLEGSDTDFIHAIVGRSEGLSPFIGQRRFTLGYYTVMAYQYALEESLSYKIKKMALSMFDVGFNVDVMTNLGMLVNRADYSQQLLSYDPVYPRRDRVNLSEFSLTMPHLSEIMAKIALKPADKLTPMYVRDTIRMLSAKADWQVDYDPDVVDAWVGQVTQFCTQEAFMIEGMTGKQCWSCGCEVKTKWHICRKCKRLARLRVPELLPESVVHVGFVPIWSKQFIPPSFTLKKDVTVFSGRKRLDGRLLPHLVPNLVGVRDPVLSQRGWLCGPMFMGFVPSCFPRGEDITLLTFCLRLGTERAFASVDVVLDVLYSLTVYLGVDVLEPETREEFLAHHKGAKLQKMISAELQEVDGSRPQAVSLDGTSFACFDAFVKAEKSHSFEYCDGLVQKPTEKPRLICSPDPLLLLTLGPYTHRQTKWLATHYSWSCPLFYAGCATPGHLRKWINRSLSKVPDAVTLADDISAIDSNYSKHVFCYLRKVRELQFPFMTDEVSKLFDSVEHLRLRFGKYRASVSYVNASGVSDTSYKNSMVAIHMRLAAFLHALTDCLDAPSIDFNLVDHVLQCVDFAASGDDGLIRSPRWVMGKDVASEMFRAKYQYAWSLFGFTVKLQVYDEDQWRLATFLGSRPVWDGSGYAWAPEPARRLRSLFWQLDCPIHPVAWARGIAQQLKNIAGHAPVLSEIASWYLDVTTGPTLEVAYNQWNPMNLEIGGVGVTQRALDEFYQDYAVTPGEYKDFLLMLEHVRDPLVNISMSIFHRIFMSE